jgi:hypothetical protein
MFAHSSFRAAVVITIVASTAAGQGVGRAAPSDDAFTITHRSSFSLSVSQSRPQGTLGRSIGRGYGLDGAYLLQLDRAGVWSIRANLGAVSYGGETRRAPLSETVGGRVTVDMSTSNYIVPMSVGPQLSWPTGIVRPYVNTGVGAQLFFTESRVQGTADRMVLASTTNHSSLAASWSFGGGVYLPLRAGKTRIDLDLGAQYIAGATQRYLAAGGIVDLPGAQIAVTPVESRTGMAIIRIGARVRP